MTDKVFALALLDSNVETVVAGLAGLSAEELQALLAAEKGGKTRKGAIEAIEAAIATVGEPIENKAADAVTSNDASPAGNDALDPRDATAVLLNSGYRAIALMGIAAGGQLGIEVVALICHEANRIWCDLNGDYSQLAWPDAPEWQQESAIVGVNFHLANPDAGDSASHDAWMAHKLADGWVWGEVKDPAAKTHPCLVPFDELPVAQQIKDRLFRTIVHGVSIAPADVDPGDATAAVVDEVRDPLAFSRHSERAEGLADILAERPVRVVFGSEDRELVDLKPIRTNPVDWGRDGGRALLRRAIDFDGESRKVTIRTIAVVDDDNAVLGVCDIPSGLIVGAGHKGRFGPGTLVF